MKKGGGDPGDSSTVIIINNNRNSNKRKIHDEISWSEEEGLPVPKHACLDTNNKNHPLPQIQDSAMSLSNDSNDVSSSSSVNWTTQDSVYHFDCQSPSLDCGDMMMMMSIPEYYETNHQPQNHGDEDGDLMFFSNAAEEASSPNYVLSSGRWNIVNNQDTEQTTEKLTIDKEFEQYFSMLML